MNKSLGLIIIVILSLIVMRDGCSQKSTMQSPGQNLFVNRSPQEEELLPLEQNIIYLKNIKELELPSLSPFREEENPFKPLTRKERQNEPPSLE